MKGRNRREVKTAFDLAQEVGNADILILITALVVYYPVALLYQLIFPSQSW